MAYTPPVGTADLALTGSYTPPVGTVNLDLGGSGGLPERTAVIAGETLAPTGLLSVHRQRMAVLAGETLAPTGAIRIHPVRQVIVSGETQATLGAVTIQRILPVRIQGETFAPTGAVIADYDSNLLSDVVRAAAGDWATAILTPQATQGAFRDSPDLRQGMGSLWQDATLQSALHRPEWRDSPHLASGTRSTCGMASSLVDGPSLPWRNSPTLNQDGSASWQEADPLRMGVPTSFRARLSLLTPATGATWQEATRLNVAVIAVHQEGLLRISGDLAAWQEAGYPGNAPNPGPVIPPIIPWPWGTNLNIRCPLPGTTLRIGRSPCILVAEREIPYRRSYMTVNSATLVRWPDLTPLPVTSMTIETDFDSWCWALTATLAGPDAWALVQPNPLACEVQATINGQVWRFLLDVPSQSRSFNSDRVTLKGRSRSAWLHDPYTPHRNFSETQARDMTQLATLALENTGWSLDWQLADWIVPAGRYNSWNTPIGVLIRLANVTDDGIYTHPTDQIITLHKRWPVASWLLDGEPMDVLIPEAAILSLTQNPVYSQPLNGVYVSGISHGALALVKIAGTDGALQPAEPITDELLCDEEGVAARQRGLNALSDSGAGWEMDAETLFNPLADPAFPLVEPGKIVSIAGLKGISRSCRITAQRSGGALSVRQSIGLERREIEV
ncbi:MAG TPA: hypothetical protein P5552_17390 [Candidatus Competibacteraceae bacterium]|nr:hypothetical protein [Candidatus Competibacteraceae bacterium]